MCRVTLTLLVVVCTLFACKPEPPEPPPQPPHDGVTVIHRGVPPYQPLRYHLARGTRTTSELVCDLAVKNNGDSGSMPALVVTLDTAVDDVLPDGSAKLRMTVVRTSVRDRAGSPVASDVVQAQAAAMHGVVITQTLAPDGQLADARVEAANVPEAMRDQLDRLSRSLQQVAMRMPAESVGVGAIWRERRTLPEGGIRATSETLYTLTSLTGSTIAYSSFGLSSGPPHTVEQDGMKVEVTDTRGHAEAKGSVDLSRYAFDATSTSTFATAMNVIAPEGTPGAGPSTVEITMAIRVASAALSIASAPAADSAAPDAITAAGPAGNATPNAAPAASDGAAPPSAGDAPPAGISGSAPSPSGAAAGNTHAPPANAGGARSTASKTSPSAATATGHSAATGHQ
jgi:hypothetical protein